MIADDSEILREYVKNSLYSENEGRADEAALVQKTTGVKNANSQEHAEDENPQ